MFRVILEIAIVLMFAGFFLGVYGGVGGHIIAGLVFWGLLSLTQLGDKINKVIFRK